MFKVRLEVGTGLQSLLYGFPNEIIYQTNDGREGNFAIVGWYFKPNVRHTNVLEAWP